MHAEHKHRSKYLDNEETVQLWIVVSLKVLIMMPSCKDTIIRVLIEKTVCGILVALYYYWSLVIRKSTAV